MAFVSAPIVSEAADYTSWEQLQNAINRGAASTYTFTQDIFITSRSECRLENLTVTNNKADYDGGGIFAHENANITLSSTTIAANKAKRGGGIGLNGSAACSQAARCTKQSLRSLSKRTEKQVFSISATYILQPV